MPKSKFQMSNQYQNPNTKKQNLISPFLNGD